MFLSRRLTPWVWAGAVAAALALLAVTASLGATVYGMPVASSLACGLAQSLGVLLSPRFPRWALTLVAIAGLSVVTLAQPTPTAPWPIPVATLLATLFVLAAASLHGQWIAAASAAVIVGITASGVASAFGSDIPVGPVIANLIVSLALFVAVIGGATLVRAIRTTRGELAAVKEISELELARRQVVEERTRIAREMHDVVAHGMSVIQVQAASARYRYPELSHEVADEFDALAATARTALGEMRSLLGVLRADDDAEQAPQPGLAQLPELVARSRAELVDRVPAHVRSGVDPVCELAVYRVAQESLGNAARHAPGAETSVELAAAPAAVAGAPARLRITIENAAPAQASGAAMLTADTSGHGIRGMRERVAALGGELSVGPTAAGGFRVVAIVPVLPGAPQALGDSESVIESAAAIETGQSINSGFVAGPDPAADPGPQVAAPRFPTDSEPAT
ncbi:signal transduction histidine kinase [Leucobacter luti]|uniref:histidine kinase n=1 Tax=Leucobacter luti TaxID=340320 RepID=A0A4R6S7Y2_9MICO|nr:histidine kinase [Leucobacter luti]TDP95387.1 signal transduction histidine kinase [Leucobacter luti]